MIPYFAYQRKRFFDFCLEKFYFFHTFCGRKGAFGPKTGTEECRKMRFTDMADEMFGAAQGALPARRGKACHSKRRGSQ